MQKLQEAKSVRYLLWALLWLCLSSGQHKAFSQSGLLWSVVKPGSSDTSYLLGTLHMYPKTVVEVPEVVTQKLGTCKSLYLEIQFDLKMAFKMLTSSSSLYNELMIDEDREWTEEDWSRIHHWFVTEHNMEEATFDRLKLNASSARLVQLYLSLYGYSFGAVEEDLTQIARNRKMSVKGLDKDWEQIMTWYAHYAKSSSGYWQQGPLDSLLDDAYYGLADLFVSYAIQDTAAIGTMEKDNEWKDGLSLVQWRNHNWMLQLPQLMQQKSFVAVGAAHLYGQHGVVQLLRNEGFICQPVQAHFGGPRLERFIRRNSRQYKLSEQEETNSR